MNNLDFNNMTTTNSKTPIPKTTARLAKAFRISAYKTPVTLVTAVTKWYSASNVVKNHVPKRGVFVVRCPLSRGNGKDCGERR
jgi:hypothetical protein